MTQTQRRKTPGTPLSNTRLDVTLLDLVAEYTVTHQFSNAGREAIEAIYSFPVPLDAAFLDMQATLAGETRNAQVLPARRATRDYDDAISQGDSAVLIEQVESGLLCVSLGNLKPGEQGEIVLRFAASLRVADRTARFSLPCVLRPRYGHCTLDEIVAPTHDFAVEHPMQASIRVFGLLAEAPVQCASHPARFMRRDGALELQIDQGMLDRDVVVNFDLQTDLAPSGRLIVDGEGTIGMISFVVPPAQGEEALPMDLCLLLDGSGSMNGDAIAQSRAALQAVAGALREDDRIQVIRFGSTTVPMFRRPLQATERVRDALGELVGTVEADLGGTEIGEALEQAIQNLKAVQGNERSAAIVLVTDGAVSPGMLMHAKAEAVAAQIRIFVVAVGGAAGTEALEPLAAATGAVLERAVPAEPINQCVMRQFRRARQPSSAAIKIDWGAEDARTLPVRVVYPGDAATAFAMLPSTVRLDVKVNLSTTNAPLRLHLAGPQQSPGLRAIAGSLAYSHAARADKEALALRYGLLTPQTSAVLVKVRVDGDKIKGMPIVQPVRPMLPDSLVASRSLLHRRMSEQPMDVSLMQHDPYAEVFADSYQTEMCPAEMREELQEPIPAYRVVEILEMVRTGLLQALAEGVLGETTLAQILAGLAAVERKDADIILLQLGFSLESKSESAVLLGCLLEAIEYEPLPDDHEAVLSILLAGRLEDIATRLIRWRGGMYSNIFFRNITAGDTSDSFARNDR